MENDSELVAECLGGNNSAWRKLVSRYARLVYSRLSETTLPLAKMQSTQSIILKKIGVLGGLARDVLFPIMSSIPFLILQRKISNIANLNEESVDAGDSPSEIVERLEKQHIVHAALAALDVPCRTLLSLLFLNDNPSSYRDIAVRLGIPIGSIGPTRRRCFMKMLRILVDEFEFQL
ncbi:MAG: hypothetical protein HY868_24585 [Chloroflexi bacterium]|nr:hypothetical protein [Chloroflexota bacterium]